MTIICCKGKKTMKNKCKYKSNFCSLDSLLANTEMTRQKEDLARKQREKGERTRSSILNNALRIQGEIFFERRVVCYHIKLIP